MQVLVYGKYSSKTTKVGFSYCYHDFNYSSILRSSVMEDEYVEESA